MVQSRESIHSVEEGKREGGAEKEKEKSESHEVFFSSFLFFLFFFLLFGSIICWRLGELVLLILSFHVELANFHAAAKSAGIAVAATK